uniref:Rho-GAP domain-containing protein n=1 Tax=Panagrellus redivivus TaxID=6233 RepID=A0A7E4ZXI1_PANRE
MINHAFCRETPPRTPDKDTTSTESRHHLGAIAANMNPPNPSGEKDSKTPVMKFSNVQRLLPARAMPEVVSVDRFTFEYIYAYNVEMDVGDTNVSSSIMMHDVPAFVVNAFKSFWEIEGYLIEGVFRKEGAAARTKDGYLPCFFGVESIPANFRVHEICSWIKRFFRDIKTPLFGDKENQLIKFADSFTDSSVKSQLHVPILNLVNGLPVAHCNTLAYLMRCLHEISEHSDVNQMTKNNLATVFAPSLFRLHGATRLAVSSKHTKSGRQRQEDMMFQMKRTNELQVLLVETLITHAYEIGLPRDYYKATRRPSDVNKKERRLIASSLYTQNVRPPVGPRVEKIRSQQSRSTTNLSYEYAQSVASSSKHVSDDEDRATVVRKRGKRSNSVLGALKSLKKSVTNMAPLGLIDKEEKSHIFSRHGRTSANKDNANAVLLSPSRRISMDPMVKSSDSESPPFIHDIGRRNVDDVLKVRSPIRSEKKRAPIPKFDSFTPTNDEKKENTGVCLSEALDQLDLSYKPTPPIRRESQKVFPLTPVNPNIANTSGSGNRPAPGAANMNRRAEPKLIDRTRRATVPAKLNLAIRRNAPNTKASGLNLPSRGHFSFRRAPANDSFSSATSDDDSLGANASINDVLEASAMESRRRRRLKKRNPSGDHSLTNLLQSSLLLSPGEPSVGPKTPTKTSATNTPQTTPLRASQAVEIPDKLEPSETSDLMTTTDQSSPELRRSSMLHDSPKSVPAKPKSPAIRSPMASPRALSVDVHITSRPTELMCAEVTPSSDSGCSSSASSKLNHRHPTAVASVSGTTISTISSEASTSTDRCASPVFLEPALPMRFQTHSTTSTSTHSTSSSVIVRPTGTSVYMPTESFRAKCRSPVRRPSSSSTASNTSRKASRSPGRVATKHHAPPMRMSTFDSSVHFKDDSRSRFGSSSSTSGICEWGRPSINQIQGSGVVNLRIQQFSSAGSPTRSSVFASVPEHPDSNPRISYKPSFARPTVASSTNARAPVHGSSTQQRRTSKAITDRLKARFASPMKLFSPSRKTRQTPKTRPMTMSTPTTTNSVKVARAASTPQPRTTPFATIRKRSPVPSELIARHQRLLESKKSFELDL